MRFICEENAVVLNNAIMIVFCLTQCVENAPKSHLDQFVVRIANRSPTKDIAMAANPTIFMSSSRLLPDFVAESTPINDFKRTLMLRAHVEMENILS